jgi:hypothetical protein
VDPIACLVDVEKKISWPYRDSNSDSSVIQPEDIRYTDCAISALPGPKRGEVKGDRRKLHIDELDKLYCSVNIVRTLKLERVNWVRH